MVANRLGGSTTSAPGRISLDAVKVLPVIRAAIGVLLLVSGCGKPGSKGQSGEAPDTAAIEGETTRKESRGGLGEMLKFPGPIDQDAEPSQEGDTSESR
jgi:hypothetical protein